MNQTKHCADSFVFKTDRPWPNARLKAAAIVGHTTSESVRLWLRAGNPGKFSVLLYPLEAVMLQYDGNEMAIREAIGVVPLLKDDVKSALQVIIENEFEIKNYESDTTYVADIDELSANTSYGYILYSHNENRVLLGHNRLRRFRTPHPECDKNPFQFALFSCNMPYSVNGLFKNRTETTNMEMWDFLNVTLERHKEEVDLVIAGGDQCYSDGVDTLNIWQLLNRTMRKENGKLLPEEDTMCSWYRDIYRGYWGFESVQRVFENFPTYMIWDDHEIGDGWGSHYFNNGAGRNGLHRLLPDSANKGLTYEEGRELMNRMFRAASQTYIEYQHSHNPATSDGIFDYGFHRGGCSFYVLDGRGQRDIAREDFRILGREQFGRLKEWADALTQDQTNFLFVVSAVPVLHTRAGLVKFDELAGGLGDDLRDAWEHELHDIERAELMKVLFNVAARGIKVSILSGDVHVSAVYTIEDDDGNRIHQLTSSAITYNLSRPQSWVLRMGAADDGVTQEGYSFKRLALYTESSYALISVNPQSGEAWFKLYGKQKLDSPSGTNEESIPLSNSLAKIRLL